MQVYKLCWGPCSERKLSQPTYISNWIIDGVDACTDVLSQSFVTVCTITMIVAQTGLVCTADTCTVQQTVYIGLAFLFGSWYWQIHLKPVLQYFFFFLLVSTVSYSIPIGRQTKPSVAGKKGLRISWRIKTKQTTRGLKLNESDLKFGGARVNKQTYNINVKNSVKTFKRTWFWSIWWWNLFINIQ